MIRLDKKSGMSVLFGDAVRWSKIMLMISSLSWREGPVKTSSSASCLGVRRRRTSSCTVGKGEKVSLTQTGLVQRQWTKSLMFTVGGTYRPELRVEFQQLSDGQQPRENAEILLQKFGTAVGDAGRTWEKSWGLGDTPSTSPTGGRKKES